MERRSGGSCICDGLRAKDVHVRTAAPLVPVLLIDVSLGAQTFGDTWLAYTTMRTKRPCHRYGGNDGGQEGGVEEAKLGATADAFASADLEAATTMRSDGSTLYQQPRPRP